MTDNDDPYDNTPCAWPECKTVGNPYKDEGWCFWLLWPGDFCCPVHTSLIEEGHRLRDEEAHRRRSSFRLIES